MHVFILVCLFRCIIAEFEVNTSSGPIRGVPSLAEDVEAFLGVPYAEPPTNHLRFARPVPKKQWAVTYNASSLPPPCPQLSIGHYYFMPDTTNMSEDCLYLNIWMPKRKSSSLNLKPVIIYIHPGGFVTGSSTLKAHDGSNFASLGDVIVVTLNYRLGAFGYFFADTEEAEGNMGMYDQITAIKWVKRNAKRFGGDPENIVLMGVSAGAYSISAHMISPLSKNLFRRAIIQSGSIVHPLFVDNNPRLYKNSQTIAFLVNCSNHTTTLKNSPHTVIQCLKKTSFQDIVAAEKELFFSNPLLFFPRVNDEFLPRSAIALFRGGNFRKDIDVLMGVTEEEGSLFLIIGLEEYFGHYGENNITLSKHLAMALSSGLLLGMRGGNSANIVRKYVNRAKNHSTIEYSKAIANIVGDFLITCNTVFLADLLSLKGNSAYFYKFEFRSPKTPMAEWMGTTHLDEVQYVFGNPYHGNFTPEEIEMSLLMIARWSAFARTGNPNLPGHMPWYRYSYNDPLYLSFGQEEESIRMKPSSRCELWRERYNAYFDNELFQPLLNSGMNAMKSNFPWMSLQTVTLFLLYLFSDK